MKKNLTMLALCFCATLLPAQTAEDYVLQGRGFLESQNFWSAHQKFIAALKVDPANEEANALVAATRLLSLPKQPASKKFLDQLGFSASGRDLLNWTATMPQNARGEAVFPSGYDSQRAAQFFRTNILPLVAQSAANLAKIKHTDFTLSLSSAETSVQGVTIDYGDIQVLRALMAAIQCAGYSLTAQNLSVVIPKLQAMDRSQTLTIQSILTSYPALLKMANPGDLKKSKSAFTDAVGLYFGASEYIRTYRAAGVNYLFNLDLTNLDDVSEEADFRNVLTNLLASLEGPVVPDARAEFVVDLGHYFSGTHTLRSLLPKFKGNDYVFNSLPDYTFGGWVKGLAACDIEQVLREELGRTDYSGIYEIRSYGGYWFEDWYEDVGSLSLYVGTNRQAVLIGNLSEGEVILARFPVDEDGGWRFSNGNVSGYGSIGEYGVWGDVQVGDDFDPFWLWLDGWKRSPQGEFGSAAGYYSGTTSSSESPKLYGILAADGAFYACAANAGGVGVSGMAGYFEPATLQMSTGGDFGTYAQGTINMATLRIQGTFESEDSEGNWIVNTWTLNSASRVPRDLPPALTISPTNMTASPGSSPTFTAKVVGSAPLSYQWYCNGERIFDSTKSTLTIKNAALGMDGNVYSVTIRNLAGETNAEATLSVRDFTPPVLAITSPKAGQLVSNAVFTAKGTASDSGGISHVWCRVNDEPWQPAASANAWANWTAELHLAPGTNTFSAFAVDNAEPANTSKTNTVRLVHVVMEPLDLVIHGKGTVAGARNRQNLALGRTVTLTATPGVGYKFLNWQTTVGDHLNGSTNRVFSFLMQSGLKAAATFIDVQKPVATIVTPLANQRWSNAVFTVKGKASDNGPGGSVLVRVNDEPHITATGWSNWVALVTLQPGTNRIFAYALDSAGNASATVKRHFVYVPCAVLMTRTSGKGTIAPNYNGKNLQLNSKFAMTAKPGTGSVFSNWVNDAGIELTKSPTLKFVMQSNLVLQANFVPNPFLKAAGSYSGLFYDPHSNITMSNAGYFSAQVSTNGSFSGKFKQGSTTRSFSGKFAADGTWHTNRIGAATNWQSSLRLGLAAENELTGIVGNGSWTADIYASRSVYSAKHPAPQFGQYTLVLPGSDDPENLPGGDGVAAVNVSKAGVVSISGTLGDRTPVTATSTVAEDGYWPLYVALYGNRGLLMGWMQFTSHPSLENDLEGSLAWIKPQVSGTALYPNGFEWPYNLSDKQAFGSRFVSRTPLLTWTNGQAVLKYGNLQEDFTNSFVMTSSTRATGTNKLSLTLTTSGITAGLFKGSLLHPDTHKSNSVNGVLLQNRDQGYGSFAGTNQTGRIRLEKQ